MKAQDPTFGAAYSVHMDAGDYIRFALGLMRGQVLEPATYETFLTPQNAAIAADDPGRALGLADWALGFSVYEPPFGRFYAHGGNNPGYSSFFFLNPETKWGAVIFTNADQATDFLTVVSMRLAGLDADPPEP